MATYRSRHYVRRAGFVLVGAFLLSKYNVLAGLALVVVSIVVAIADMAWRLHIARNPQSEDPPEPADKPVVTAPIYGLPRLVFEGTGGRLRIPNKLPTEKGQRRKVDQIRQHYGKGKIVLVVGPKGEAGKTTNSLGIGQALAASGVSVVVFDLNGAGNLAQRVGKGSSWPSITKLHTDIESFFEHGGLTQMLPRHVFRGSVDSPNVVSTDVGADIVGRPMEGEHPLTTRQTLDVLEAACNHYDIVIVDANNRLKFALGSGEGPDGESNDVTDVLQGVFEVSDVVVHSVTTKYDSQVLGFELARTLQKSSKPVVTVVNEKTKSADEVTRTVSLFLKFSDAVRVIPYAVPLSRRDIFWWGNLTGKQQRWFVAVAAVVVALARADKVDQVPPGLKFINLRAQAAAKAKIAASLAEKTSQSDNEVEPAPPVRNQELASLKLVKTPSPESPVRDVIIPDAAISVPEVTIPDLNGHVDLQPVVVEAPPTQPPVVSPAAPFNRKEDPSSNTAENIESDSGNTPDDDSEDEGRTQVLPGEESFEDIAMRLWPEIGDDKTAVANAVQDLRTRNPHLVTDGQDLLFAFDFVNIG